MKENKINNLKKNFVIRESKTTRNKEKLSLGIERYINISEAMNTWKRAFLGMTVAAILLIAVSGFLFLNKSKTQSYLIKVNNNGELIGTEKLKDKITTIGKKEVGYFIKKFIKDTRIVTLDKKVFQKTIKDVSYFLNEETQNKIGIILGQEKINSFFEQNKTRDVEILSFNEIPQIADTYQVRWREKTFDKDGNLEKRQNLNAILKVKSYSPNSEQFELNPFGLIIVDFNMQVEN